MRIVPISVERGIDVDVEDASGSGQIWAISEVQNVWTD